MRSLKKASENARLLKIVADRGRTKPGDDKVAYSELTVYERRNAANCIEYDVLHRKQVNLVDLS